MFCVPALRSGMPDTDYPNAPTPTCTTLPSSVHCYIPPYPMTQPMLKMHHKKFVIEWQAQVHNTVQMSLWQHMTGQLSGRVMTPHYGVVIPPWGGSHFQLHHPGHGRGFGATTVMPPLRARKRRFRLDPMDQFLAGLT